MRKERVFKLTEIVKIFDINRHFVINLVEKKIIKPLQDAKGRGKVRLYSYINVLQIGIFIYLIKFDLSYSKARAILNVVQRMSERGTLEGLFYISVVGFVKKDFEKINTMDYERHIPDIIPFLADYYGGDNELGPYGVYGYYNAEILPQEALDKTIQYVLQANPDMSIDHLAQYFILDFRNIKKHIDSRIIKL